MPETRVKHTKFALNYDHKHQGTVVGEVSARDQDYGLDWKIVYGVVMDGTNEELFNVTESGQIVLKQAIDRESLSSDSTGLYRFQIEVQ